ncbi:MAG TPA: heparinase II/III family protein [Rhizomicrobium sp.]
MPAHGRAGPTFAMAPELCSAALRLALAPFRVAWRGSWVYRQFLHGRMPDRVRHHPFDAMPRRLEDADSILKGRFRFGDETVDLKQGSVFDIRPPSTAWFAALHGFEWLPALSKAGGAVARDYAAQLITEWLDRYSRYSEPSWLPEIMARRMNEIFAHGRFVIANSDMLWRSRLFVSLRQHAALLGRIADEAEAGLPRLEASVACVLSCAALGEEPKRLELALTRLEREINLQFLPDGGHVSRSPEELLLAYRQIVMAQDALTAMNMAVPPWLRSTHDRVAPMLRFFRCGDGALALFNGGGENNARTIEALLARDEVRGQPFMHAPYSGYQRLAAARSLAIMDCGAPPPEAYSTRAHAGCLAFEFSSAGQRIVVNCGAEKDGSRRWDGALRATAAHSTVTLADTSMMPVLAQGFARRLLGPRLLTFSQHPETNRQDTQNGWRVEASHAYYVPDFRIAHRREITLSMRGTKLTGCDHLFPDPARGDEPVPFAVRFHIHPDVRLSPSLSGDILLKLANGEGWRFRHAGGVTIEESVYAGQTDIVRHGEQLVLRGAVTNEPVAVPWVFEQIGTE